MSLLSIKNLTCSYTDKQILNNLSMEVPVGQIVGLLGANGSGKTTLLKCIGNVISYSGNIILIEDKKELLVSNLSPRELAKKISYIPQHSGISIDISCLDVVLMGLNPSLNMFERPNAAMVSKAIDILTMMDLKNRIYSNYLELSQGQKQLCLLARTLIGSSSLLLLDEPESSLDFGHRYKSLKLVRNHIGDSKSALITLHDPQLALNYCDTINVINNGHCISSFEPSKTPEKEIEKILSQIYGPICINSCYNRNSKKSYVVQMVD